LSTSPTRVIVVLAVGCLVVLTACTGPANEREQSPSASPHPIPQVTNPRDVAVMARRTCELLTPQQAGGFGLDLPPQQFEGLFGTVNCEWRTTTRDRRVVRRVGVSVFTDNPTLEVVYRQRASHPFFELTQIGGYPAIATRSNADLPICDIDLKPAERQSVTVSYSSEEFDNDPQQACSVGKQVAEAVLTDLPPLPDREDKDVTRQ